MYSSDMYMANEIADATMSSAAMTGLFMGIMIFSVVLGLISIISYWKIFNKAGKPGWASLIPIYNYVVMLQIAQLSIVYLLLLIIPIANIFATFKINIEIAKKFGNSSSFGVGLALLPIIFAPLLAFSDNVYEDNQFESKENNVDPINSSNNITVNVNMTNENAVNIMESQPKNLEQDIINPNTDNNLTSELIKDTAINNENIVQKNVEPVSINSEDTVLTDISATPNFEMGATEPNMDEPVVNMAPPVIENSNPVSNDIPVVEEVKAEPTQTINAFNSTPIETQQANEETPSLDVKITNDAQIENIIETQTVPEIISQPITEIPVSENTNSTETKKVCKNCGEVLPNIVSICPKCGTDNE